jgi:hypothetical protein
MCCCAKPNVNGTFGYSWDGKGESTRPVAPPALGERDVLLYDEPGRCGGMDSHCHHYRLVKDGPWVSLLVRHGGGDERMHLSLPRGFAFDSLDSSTRYWVFSAIYHASSDARRAGEYSSAQKYTRAFVDGRLKKRKNRGADKVKVWIEPVVTRQEVTS